MRRSTICILALSLFFSCADVDRYRREYKSELETKKAANTNRVGNTQKDGEFEVIVIKHPDLNYTATDPDSLVIYEGFEPLNPEYFMIGKIGIIETNRPNPHEVWREIKRKASEIGGHAIIIIDVQSETKEIESNMIKMTSIPKYFWWDGVPHYMGSEYFAIKFPDLTINSLIKVGIIVKFMDRTLREIVPLWLEKYKHAFPGVKKSDVIKRLLEKDEEGKYKYYEMDILSAIKISYLVNEVNRSRAEISKWKKIYPLANMKEVSKLLDEKDENGNSKYTLEQAMKISHEKNQKKK